MSKISLPKVVECMQNGLASLEAEISATGKQIDWLTEKRNKALIEAKLQRDALKAIAELDTELAKDGSTLTLRFPE
jgi:ribulose kinase